MCDQKAAAFEKRSGEKSSPRTACSTGLSSTLRLMVAIKGTCKQATSPHFMDVRQNPCKTSRAIHYSLVLRKTFPSESLLGDLKWTKNSIGWTKTMRGVCTKKAGVSWDDLQDKNELKTKSLAFYGLPDKRKRSAKELEDQNSDLN